VALFGGGAYVANETFNNNNDKDHSFINDHDELAGIPMGDLSETEREGLIMMREEEKLARDVYRTMFDMWGVKTFQNISYSNQWIASTDNEDIRMVYENLLRGSRNHMRSFDKQIVKNGGAYTAQYLTQAEIDEILAGEYGCSNCSYRSKSYYWCCGR